MPLRKRLNRGVLGDSRQEVGGTQEDNAHSDKDEAPGPARRERPHKPKTKDMTEEEMMDLALRLSEQEANVTALRLREEEEAVRRAIRDSVRTTEPPRANDERHARAQNNTMLNASQSLLDDAPPCASSRRKLLYSNGESQAQTVDGRSQRAARHMAWTRTRRRAEGSPLMELPDLSQTQPSPGSSASAALGSPQSADSTQIQDCDLPKSPVFPSSPSAPVPVWVQIPRLDQDVLDSCTASGFVLCSQDRSATTWPPQRRARSPTFPQSPAPCTKNPASKRSRTEIFDVGKHTPPNPSSARCSSPVFWQADSKCAFKSEAGEAAAPAFSSQESAASFCAGNDAGEQRSAWDLSELEPTCDMTLHWSDEDEGGATPSPSPVFPEERRVPQNDGRALGEQQEPTRTRCRTAGPQAASHAPSSSGHAPSAAGDAPCSHGYAPSAASDTPCSSGHAPSGASDAPCSSGHAPAQATVHYYWGVPFCPRGLDPNNYTKVIVAQLEVYEKSLKLAQRRLLHKVTWGRPILPRPEKSPSPESNSQTRRSRRRKGKPKEPESDEEAQRGKEEGDEEAWKEAWKETGKETRKETGKETGKETRKETRKEPDEEQAPLEHPDQDGTRAESDCEVCPETQLSDDDVTQELTPPPQELTPPPQELTPSPQELTPPPQAPVGNPEVEAVRVDSPDEAERAEPMEAGPESRPEPEESPAPLHSKPAAAGAGCHSSESREAPGPQRPESPEPDSDQAPGPEGAVQCPLCQRGFPSDQIEMHAAFCDGELEADDRASPKPRRKRTRRDADDNENGNSEPSVALEKCYVCHRSVPIREYGRHTEKCLQRRAPRAAAAGGLLSALDQSEHKDPSEAGPSGAAVAQQEVIDLLDDDDDDSVSLIRVSHSPIRSFTSISEAQDCLIDFRSQHRGKRLRPRAGLRAGPREGPRAGPRAGPKRR